MNLFSTSFFLLHALIYHTSIKQNNRININRNNLDSNKIDENQTNKSAKRVNEYDDLSDDENSIMNAILDEENDNEVGIIDIEEFDDLLHKYLD